MFHKIPTMNYYYESLYLMIEKSELIHFLQSKLKGQLQEIEAETAAIENEIANETKSSAGDKFETSREMMNQSRDRLQENAAIIVKHLKSINAINSNKKIESVIPGALIITNFGSFLFGPSIGTISFQNQTLFCLSITSPIGVSFANKIKGEQVEFRGRSYQIQKII
jgi:hypothetical protein